jgi:DHA1 family tetracycline resistance protein-like MFS transporter
MTLWRNRKPGVGFVLVVLAFDSLSLGLIIPIVPELVRQLSGRDASGASVDVGLLVATFALAQFLAAPLLGGLSDRYGRRPVIVLSIAGAAANYLLLAFAPSLGWLYLGRALAGVSAANTSSATAYIADVSTPEQRARRFGLVGATFSLGFVLGPITGGVFGAIYLRLPFLVAAGLATANALYGLLLLPESLPPGRRQAFAWRGANPLSALRMLAGDAVLGRLALAWSAVWFAIGTLQTVFVLSTALRFGWGSLENGAALGLVGVTGAIVQGFLVRRVVALLGERRAAMLGLLGSTAAFATIGLATQGWMIFPGIALQAFGGLANPTIRALVSVRAGPDRQGRIMGALSSVEGLTAIASPILASTLFRLFAGPGAFAEISGMPFLATALLFLAAMLAIRVAPSGSAPA